MGETNGDLARHGFAAISHGDFGAIERLLAPAVKWHGGDPTAPGACRDRRQALNVMRRAQKGGVMPELVDVIELDDKVVVLLRPRGSDPGSVVANLTTFRDGQVVEMVHYADPEEALAAVRAEG